MSSGKYIYDPGLMKFEKARISFRSGIRRSFTLLGLTFLFSVWLFHIYNELFQSPKLKILSADQNELLLKFDLLERNTHHFQKLISALEYNDDHIFRTYFEVDPLPSTTRNAGFGGDENYTSFMPSSYFPMVSGLARQLDILVKKTRIQSRSLDEIMEMARDKEKRLAARPAIQPIRISDLIRFGSSFGMRLHPITQQYKMHEGIDLTAARGSKVFATADGVATVASFCEGGYGNKIVLDHGFGYESLYGHLHKILIKPGQHVKRGEVIGLVGMTGLSTCPHLHYEVVINGKKVNPLNYYTNDLSASEYDRVVGLLAKADPGFDIN